ncbi:MAG: MoaD/ThiS family protein [Desulfobacteraceae bacterium]|nr:MAG: MoaD/ThiS family protein [Desulfobacteraceae bacterium]
MSIKVHIHKTHRQFTNGLDVVEVEGNTVGNCLNQLVGQFPGIEKEIYDKKGDLRNIIEIYLNLESAYPDELAKPVKDGDDIHITLILAGG